MSPLLIVHIAGGTLAILSGALALAAHKGGSRHAQAGSWFFGSMLVLGTSAALLAAALPVPDLGRVAGGIFADYLVVTSWATARWQDGRPTKLDKLACCSILSLAAFFVGAAIVTTRAHLPIIGHYGAGFYLALASVSGLWGALDLNVIVRSRISGKQRISRHLWRMCFAFFFATGSFFLGQQKVMPASIRGSLILLVLGLAPLAFMIYWLLRIRFAKAFRSTALAFSVLGRRPLSQRHARAASTGK
jgi:hypothetical protein